MSIQFNANIVDTITLVKAISTETNVDISSRCLVVTTMILDFHAFITKRLLSYHSFMAVTHFCVRLHYCNSLTLLAEQYTSVSSAYQLQAPKSTCILISLTYNKNKIGPKTDPWGTPILSWRFTILNTRTTEHCIENSSSNVRLIEHNFT